MKCPDHLKNKKLVFWEREIPEEISDNIFEVMCPKRVKRVLTWEELTLEQKKRVLEIPKSAWYKKRKENG